MRCEDVRKSIPLLLYGELSFDEEERLENHLADCQPCHAHLEHHKRLQSLFDSAAHDVPPDLLLRSRQELRWKLSGTSPARPNVWERLGGALHIQWGPITATWRPFGALALIAVGFFGGRLIPENMLPEKLAHSGLGDPTYRVRNIEQEPSGNVKVDLDEIHTLSIVGSANDKKIQDWLFAGSRDLENPGVRINSVTIMTGRCESPDVRTALLATLQQDVNAGVRLKALQALKPYISEREVRTALTKVLMTDRNSGLRTAAIDALMLQKEPEVVGQIQDAAQRDPNPNVRERCQGYLQQIKASPMF